MQSDTSYVKSRNKQIKVKVAKSFDQVHPRVGVFLFGANHTLANLYTLPPSTLLLPEDFKSSITFDISYKNMRTGSFPKKFRFKHMLPNVFRQLRSKFNVNENQFISSFKNEPTQILCKNMNIYESANQLFIFKVVENEYIDGLVNLMPSYFRYLSERKFSSLLPQYCAIFKLNIENKKTNIVVMKNIMAGSIRNYKSFQVDYLYEKDQSKDIDNTDEKKRKKSVDTQLPPPPSPPVESITINDDTKPIKFQFNVSEATKKCIIDKATNDAKFLCENHVYGWSLLGCKIKPAKIDKHTSCPSSSTTNTPSKNKRMSYNPVNLLENQRIPPITIPLHEGDFQNLNIPSLSNYFVNTGDMIDHYLGCLDISSHCKHVKKSFTDRPKKKHHNNSQNKPSDNEQSSTTQNNQKFKSRFANPDKYIKIVWDIFAPIDQSVKSEPSTITNDNITTTILSDNNTNL